jgi:C-terminal processing protease CtpA/Prc
LASLRIGSFAIDNPVALFAQDKAGAFADASLAGNIGAQIASRFHLVLDYAGRRIIVEPSPTFEEPFDRAFSGMNLRAEGPDYHTFRVREVLEDSPATEAGIEQGDVISAIDGASAESLTLTTMNEMLEEPVPRQLIVRRGERTLHITVTPRRLV